MVGVVDCLESEMTLPAVEATKQSVAEFNASRATLLDSSLDSSNQTRFSGMRNCSVLSPDVEKRRILQPVGNLCSMIFLYEVAFFRIIFIRGSHSGGPGHARVKRVFASCRDLLKLLRNI